MANIVLLSLLLISLGVALVAYRGGALVPLVLWRDDRLLFLAYCLVFISTWFVYFCSDRRSYSLEVRTLRRLLLARSVHWKTPGDEKAAKREVRADRIKGERGLDTAAILIAVSSLEVSQALQMLNAATAWESILLRCTIALGVASFLMFVVSTDALDSMFNSFACKKEEAVIVRYLYVTTVNHRYYGLVCMLLSLVTMIASKDPCLGASALALLIGLGYGHWFPYIQCSDGSFLRPYRHTRFAAFALMAAAPFFMIRG